MNLQTLVCHFFAVGFSLVAYSSASPLPHPPPPPLPFPPNSRYNLNTCNEALQHMYRPYTVLNSVWLYLTLVSPVQPWKSRDAERCGASDVDYCIVFQWALAAHTKLDCIKGLVACRQHVINRVFTSSSFGPHGVVDRAVGGAVGRAYRIKRLGVEYWAKCHFDCATAFS